MLQHDRDEMQASSEEGRLAETRCPWCKSDGARIQNGVFCCSRCNYRQDVSNPPEIQVIGWTDSRDMDFKEIDCKNVAIYRAIVREVCEKGYSFGWGDHQSSCVACTPIINNGYKISCGFRTWASIMAEAHGDGASFDELYPMYAFGCVDAPIYPKKEIDYQRIIPFEIEY